MEQENKKQSWDITKIILAFVAGISVTALAFVVAVVILLSSGVAVASIPFVGNWLSSLSATQEPAPDPDTSLSYTVSDEVAITANPNLVAAVGDLQLTNGQLQIHYWTQIYSFVNEYGVYLSYFGLDFTKPLGEQTCALAEQGSWEDFFLEMALDSWAQAATIKLMAEEEGYALSEEQKAELEAIIESVEQSAPGYGYASLEDMVKTEMGAGAKVEDYIAYVELDYFCSAYAAYLQEKNVPNEEQLQQYYTDNEETIVNAGYGKDAGKVVDIRHVLIKPEGGTLNDDGYTYTYTDEQWEAAREKAQKLYDAWLEGKKDEDSFGVLAKNNSADSSASSGGLITDLAKGKTVEGFDDWIFAEGREYGDHGLVKTVYGYHIIFYVADEEAWLRYCEANYANDIISTQLTKFAEDYAIQTDYDLIAIGQVDLAG